MRVERVAELTEQVPPFTAASLLNASVGRLPAFVGRWSGARKGWTEAFHRDEVGVEDIDEVERNES